jgi:hypothetical protein
MRLWNNRAGQNASMTDQIELWSDIDWANKVCYPMRNPRTLLLWILSSYLIYIRLFQLFHRWLLPLLPKLYSPKPLLPQRLQGTATTGSTAPPLRWQLRARKKRPTYKWLGVTYLKGGCVVKGHMEDPAIVKWQESMRNIPTTQWGEFEQSDWLSAMNKISSWKAPGRDGLSFSGSDPGGGGLGGAKAPPPS